MKRLLLFLCLLFITRPGWAAEPAVRIGFLGPMTGYYSSIGKEARDVLTLLISDINNQGGLLGRKVELVFEDEGDNLQSTAAAGAKLVMQGVVAAIGPSMSDATDAVQGIFNDSGIVHISYGATAISLTEKRLPYFFRTCPRDDEQAKAFVRIIRKMKIGKVALLHDNSLYGKGLGEAIRDQLHAWMLDPVFYGTLTPGRSDYADILEQIKKTAPEVVFFAGYYPEAARLLQGREQLRWGVPFVGGDAVNNPGLVEIAGINAAENFLILSPPNPEHLDTPWTKSFLDRFRHTYGYTPSSIFALLAGNAINAVTDSVAIVGTTDPLQVSDYLHRHYFKKSGLTGEIFFNSKGDVVNDLYALYRVDGRGRLILRKQLQQIDSIEMLSENQNGHGNSRREDPDQPFGGNGSDQKDRPGHRLSSP